jgi:GTP-binding protein HflX
VQELGEIIARERVEIAFVNYTLTSVQMRNLERSWNDIIRKEEEGSSVRVIDRFGIILRIFAERAKTRMAQIQLQLAMLKYVRPKLVRHGSDQIGGLLQLFEGVFKE